MTEWEPATEAEAAMREALHANDQQLYFRILARTDLLLPVSAQALAGQAPPGWGTWTTGGRTHVLAFTSAAAMRVCLGDNAGSSRRVPYTDLAEEWPDQEWWLAVNPGLPIEGYLPSWFVAQLSRGDVRLPGRTLGARARLERAETLARARATSVARDADAVPSTGPQGRTTTANGVPPAPTPDHADALLPPTPRPSVEGAPAGRTRAEPPRVDAVTNGQWPAPPPYPSTRPGDAAEGRPVSPWPSARPEVGADRPATAEGRAGAEGGDRPNRSFFEPASGRGSAYRDPVTRAAADRAAPPSRFAGGSQPFPRRRPPSEGPTDAFRTTDPAAAPPAEETTQALPARPGPSDDERTRPIRVPDPARLQANARRPAEPDADGTQVLPRRRPGPAGPDPAEDLPASIAEPVSAPPAPRRGFTPIVIEGTIIEARDVAPPLAAATEPARSLFDPEPTGTTPPTVVAGTSTGFAETGGTSAGPAESAGVTARPAEPAEPVSPATGPLIGTGSDRVDPTADPTWTATPTTVDPGPAADPMTDVPPSSATADFLPANEVEEDLLGASGTGSTDTFLSTLLLARVLLPVTPESTPGSRPGEPGFVWHREELDGETCVVVYTSPERLADNTDAPVETLPVKFVQLIHRWPDESWSFVVNPGTPIGAKLPGEQIVGLASWAAEVGLGTDAGSEPEPSPAEEPVARTRYTAPAPDPARPVVMQKAVAPSQLAYYLERGYDRVSGFVHRAGELAHLTTPAELYDALGLGYPDSPFRRDAGEIYVLRWPAHRPSLYRIPYGGQNEAAMRAMEGWVIERPPFRGNGFAPGESSDVVAEFKVDSARLPHGAQLWRVGADGTERVVALLDTDALLWREVGAGDA
ncbi:SseB family protein [Micromonospora sp. NPDC049799]|uniref:SseB family protein n=1 Tax=Micromonospora sp. NPDC049799 TaxID=3154741 RepID=UPI0033C2AB03